MFALLARSRLYPLALCRAVNRTPSHVSKRLLSQPPPPPGAPAIPPPPPAPIAASPVVEAAPLAADTLIPAKKTGFWLVDYGGVIGFFMAVSVLGGYLYRQKTGQDRRAALVESVDDAAALCPGEIKEIRNANLVRCVCVTVCVCTCDTMPAFCSCSKKFMTLLQLA